MANGTRQYIISRQELQKYLSPRGLGDQIKSIFRLDRLPLSASNINSIKEFENERIFIEGRNSADAQTGKARWRTAFERRGNKLTERQERKGTSRTSKKGGILGFGGRKVTTFTADYASTGEIRRYPYRFRSGQLKNSQNIQVKGNKLIFTYRREEVILKSLEDRYGKFLAPSPSTIEFVGYMLLRNQGLLPPGVREPTPPWR